MIAFMSKTLNEINKELKQGKSVVTTADKNIPATGTSGQGETDRKVDAVTTATLEGSLHLAQMLPVNRETR